MRFLGYMLADESMPVPPPAPELMAGMGKFVEEATKAGGDLLHKVGRTTEAAAAFEHAATLARNCREQQLLLDRATAIRMAPVPTPAPAREPD